MSKWVINTLIGFRDFIFQGNVIDLAVAIVVGAAFTALVNAFVRDFITPLLAAIGGHPYFGDLYFTVNNSKFLYGDFFNAALTFVLTCTVIYFLLVLPFNKFLSKFKHSPTTKNCSYCLSIVPIKATRCMYCCSCIEKNEILYVGIEYDCKI